MRCVDKAGLRERIEELLCDSVGFERLSTFDQAEALIAVAVRLLDCRGGPGGRDDAALRAHDLVERCREAARVPAARA